MTTGIIEIVWTLTSFLGAAFALYGVIDAVQDYRALDKATAQDLITLGKTLIATETMRLIIQCSHFGLGVTLILNPTNKLQLSAAILILIGTGLLLMISTFLTLRIRLRIAQKRRVR